MRQAYHIILTNCDCASDVIARLPSQVRKWFFGPRCPSCRKILGWMQWRLACKGTFMAEGELEALRKYKEVTCKVAYYPYYRC